MMYTFVHFS